MRLIIDWVTIYQFFFLSLWISLGNDTIGYYPILVILGNSWLLVILIFSIIICSKTKLDGVGKVKKPNLKLVINLIYLMVLGIYFKKGKLGFGCNFEL